MFVHLRACFVCYPPVPFSHSEPATTCQWRTGSRRSRAWHTASTSYPDTEVWSLQDRGCCVPAYFRFSNNILMVFCWELYVILPIDVARVGGVLFEVCTRIIDYANANANWIPRARLVNWRFSLLFLMCAILVAIPLAFSLLLSLAKTSLCLNQDLLLHEFTFLFAQHNVQVTVTRSPSEQLLLSSQ